MKRIFIMILAIVLMLGIAACSVEAVNTTAKDDAVSEDARIAPSGYGSKSGIKLDSYAKDLYDAEAGFMIPGEGSKTEEKNEIPTPRAGLLTSCAYADWEYNAFWQGLLTSNQEGQGKFAEYFDTYAFKALRQVKVTIPGIAGAKVALLNDEAVLSTACTNNAGIAYLFAPAISTEDLTVKATAKDADGNEVNLEKAVVNGEAAFTQEEVIAATTNQFNRIEIMFVIDTTGSMGDEISYLKEEIADVIGRIKSATDVDVLLAIMVYRDEGDEYVTRYNDFTTDIAAQQAFLSKQEASGGGDFPEAVQTALTEAVDKQWSKTATKLLIHVADAPAHNEDVETWQKAAAKAAEAGIRIVSVASSGIDAQTEYFFRAQSLMTGGVYVWLTDDSGIGGAHLEATVEHRPEVEALNDCLVRVVKALHTGNETITLPAPAQPEQKPAEQQQPTGPSADQPTNGTEPAPAA